MHIATLYAVITIERHVLCGNFAAETVSIQDRTDQHQANVPFGNGPGMGRESNPSMLMCVQGRCKRNPAELSCVYVPMCLQKERAGERASESKRVRERERGR